MSVKYCFWSVADGDYGALMEQCVRTAHTSGVFKEFHVLCDRPLQGCHCYDAFKCDKTHGLFKLHYLKVGMSRMTFDYFVWLDADTVFVRNPLDLLGTLCNSPIHVPLEGSLASVKEDRKWKGTTISKLRELFREGGIVNELYLSQSAFWIVHRDAIDQVYDLALQFWNRAKTSGILLDVSAALGYAMQLLCANPEAHLVTTRPDVWASDDSGQFAGAPPDGQPWNWRLPLKEESVVVQPCIVHLPTAKRDLFQPKVQPEGSRSPEPLSL